MRLGSSGMRLGSSGMRLGSSGMRLGSSGMRLGSSGMRLGSPGMRLGSSGMRLGSSGMRLGSSGMRLGSPGMRLGSSGMRLQAGHETLLIDPSLYLTVMILSNRIGLMGNPSDGFHGKTIALSIANFWAEVTIIESAKLVHRVCSVCLLPILLSFLLNYFTGIYYSIVGSILEYTVVY